MATDSFFGNGPKKCLKKNFARRRWVQITSQATGMGYARLALQKAVTK